MTKFEWSDKCEEAVRELKRRFTTAPILILLVEAKEYTICSDPSGNRLSYVLIQYDKVIAYASK